MAGAMGAAGVVGGATVCCSLNARATLSRTFSATISSMARAGFFLISGLGGGGGSDGAAGAAGVAGGGGGATGASTGGESATRTPKSCMVLARNSFVCADGVSVAVGGGAGLMAGAGVGGTGAGAGVTCGGGGAGGAIAIASGIRLVPFLFTKQPATFVAALGFGLVP